jgi:hypothetical protein
MIQLDLLCCDATSRPLNKGYLVQGLRQVLGVGPRYVCLTQICTDQAAAQRHWQSLRRSEVYDVCRVLPVLSMKEEDPAHGSCETSRLLE